MSKGKVDIRKSQRDGRYRLRFYGLGADQVDTILLALKSARLESNTEYDSVALDRVALHFLSTYQAGVVPPTPFPQTCN
jgi:hypothetical protein